MLTYFLYFIIFGLNKFIYIHAQNIKSSCNVLKTFNIDLDRIRIISGFHLIVVIVFLVLQKLKEDKFLSFALYPANRVGRGTLNLVLTLRFPLKHSVSHKTEG